MGTYSRLARSIGRRPLFRRKFFVNTFWSVVLFSSLCLCHFFLLVHRCRRCQSPPICRRQSPSVQLTNQPASLDSFSPFQRFNSNALHSILCRRHQSLTGAAAAAPSQPADRTPSLAHARPGCPDQPSIHPFAQPQHHHFCLLGLINSIANCQRRATPHTVVGRPSVVAGLVTR